MKQNTLSSIILTAPNLGHSRSLNNMPRSQPITDKQAYNNINQNNLLFNQMILKMINKKARK